MTTLRHDHLLSPDRSFWAPFSAKRSTRTPGLLTFTDLLVNIERFGSGIIEVRASLWHRLIRNSLPAFQAICQRASQGHIQPKEIHFDWTRDLMADMALLRLTDRWPLGEVHSLRRVVDAWHGLTTHEQDAVMLHLGQNGDLATAAQLTAPSPTLRPEKLPLSPIAQYMKWFAKAAKSQSSWDPDNDCRWDFVFGPFGNTICGLIPSRDGDIIMPIWTDVDIPHRQLPHAQPGKHLIDVIAFYHARARRFDGAFENDIRAEHQRFRQNIIPR